MASTSVCVLTLKIRTVVLGLSARTSPDSIAKGHAGEHVPAVGLGVDEGLVTETCANR